MRRYDRELSAEEHKKRLVWKYVTLRNYLETGMLQTRFLNYFLLVFGTERAVANAYGTALLMGLAYFVVCVICGWLWDRFQCYGTELEWKQSRSPFAHEVRQALRKGKI